MVDRARFCVVAALVAATAITLSAQQRGGLRTGSPTPGTPQPDPPNLADRITLTGCVERARPSNAKPAPSATDPNTPSNSRYVLTNVERKNIVPPGTGTSSLAAARASATYRLNAIDSQLSGFVGAKVEISGAVLPPNGNEASGGASTGAPTLQVEFVQRLAKTCS